MTTKPDKVQGEGNYEAAKEYNDATRKFVKSGRVEAAAQEAAPKTRAEAAEMRAAEAVGLSHAGNMDQSPKDEPTPKGPDLQRLPIQDPKPDLRDPAKKRGGQSIGRTPDAP
ncbi:MAG: hypothetical protein ABI607_11110 [Betaproteobacteria bacterium]